jgi:two-component system, cell cycle response regulator
VPPTHVSARTRLLLRLCALAGVLALGFHLAHGQFGLGGHGLDAFADEWLYDAIIVASALSCFTRAWLVPKERVAWIVLGAGLGFDALGEIYYSLAFGDSATAPVPSLADLFYLLYYPAVYVALVLFVRHRIGRVRVSAWLDGAIAAVTAAAVVVATVFEPIMHSATQGSAASVATSLAYPICDLLLLAVVIGVFSLANWRPGRRWLLLGAGLAVTAIADTAYLYAAAKGTYRVGGVLDSLWLAAALAIAAAPWQRARRLQPSERGGMRVLLLPGCFAVLALGVLIYGGFHRVGTGGLILAGLAMTLVIARGALTLRENLRLLEVSQREAVTDALTGLGNRRHLNAALDRVLDAGPRSAAVVLVVFDLDGFKLYNDSFGHLAGDTLLSHLGDRLAAAVAGGGSAFRLGGDEFCVLIDRDPEHADDRVAACIRALSADGDGFSVGVSFGRVSAPREAETPTTALRLADDRMYARKGSRRGSARQQSHDVLLRLLRERQPELHEHMREVGRLAVAVGRRLAMTEEELDEVSRAAELHDIGKAAIPDAILASPNQLDERELAFMRRHTIVGERILAAAPALAPVARLVRSSHEHWDGTGYPDRIAGTAIPLGARIVAVCDAFDAMVSDRPYAAPRTPTQALAELGRNAGSQFDPQVVATFAAAWADRVRRPELVSR